MAAGEPCLAADADASERGLARLRAHRAVATLHGVRSVATSFKQLLAANTQRVAGLPAADADAWDRLAEAWLVTRVAPDRAGAWTRPLEWRSGLQAHAAAKALGSWRAALERLGYAQGAWPRSRAMAASLGARDPSAVSHADPLFAWELFQGLLARPPTTLWERCAAALAVTAALSAGRPGNVCASTREDVDVQAPDTVSFAPAARKKQQRDRPVGSAGQHRLPVVLRHWAVRRFVVPWVTEVARIGVRRTGLLFPTILHDGVRIRKSVAGFAAAGGFWVEPTRTWDVRPRHCALARFVADLRGRTFRSCRAGNNTELRRQRRLVSDVTRRVLHGRSVRALIGSEAAYTEVFAEDLAKATALLGQLRIVRDQRSGLLTTVASSASAGERDDWVTAAGAGGADASSGDSSDAASSDAASGASMVSSQGGRHSYHCFRCRRFVRFGDDGFMCDVAGCTRGTCLPCHPRGTRSRLLCPDHE